MKIQSSRHISRRAVLRHAVFAVGTVAALPLAGIVSAATAAATEEAGKADQKAVQYQDHPKGTSACANCANFIPGAHSGEPGACTVVAGEISPKGWCLAYAGNG